MITSKQYVTERSPTQKQGPRHHLAPRGLRRERLDALASRAQLGAHLGGGALGRCTGGERLQRLAHLGDRCQFRDVDRGSAKVPRRGYEATRWSIRAASSPPAAGCDRRRAPRRVDPRAGARRARCRA